jgi:outer membrane biosynthesis protein TonB
MGGIVPFAIQLLSAIPGLIASGAQAIALIEAHTAALKAMVAEGRSPTQDEWNALNATIGGLEVQLDAPLDAATTVASVEPAPVEQAPVEPAPAPVPAVEPAPVEQAPVEPAPAPVPAVEPAPAEPPLPL